MVAARMLPRRVWLLSALAAPVVLGGSLNADKPDDVCLLQTSYNFANSSAVGQPENAAQDLKDDMAMLQEEEEALQKFDLLSFPDGEDCPTSYIYDIPELWDLDRPMRDIPKLGEAALNDIWEQYHPCQDNLTYHLNQYTMPVIVLYRLLTSKRCKVTKNPEEADLFIVPYLNQPKRLEEYCTERFIDPEPHLKHLNAKTAHRHLFMLGKGHLLLSHCGEWWIRPRGLLSHSIRIAYSAAFRDPSVNSSFGSYGPPDGREVTLGHLAKFMSGFDRDDVDFPHTFSVPYPATGVLGTSRQEVWRDYTSKRPVLSYFLGGVHGRYGLEIRGKLVKDCVAAGEPTCVWRSGQINPCEVMGLKQQALFCLEPGGDSPYRKSLWDDLSLGCVPVLFSPYMQLVAPWHWGHFRNTSHVVINYADYMEDKIDLFKILKEVAESPRMLEMRKSIAQNAHAVQYSRTDYPGDGVERLLIGAHHAATQYEVKNKVKAKATAKASVAAKVKAGVVAKHTL